MSGKYIKRNNRHLCSFCVVNSCDLRRKRYNTGPDKNWYISFRSLLPAMAGISSSNILRLLTWVSLENMAVLCMFTSSANILDWTATGGDHARRPAMYRPNLGSGKFCNFTSQTNKQKLFCR